jgi:hypothetical protein
VSVVVGTLVATAVGIVVVVVAGTRVPHNYRSPFLLLYSSVRSLSVSDGADNDLKYGSDTYIIC